MEEVSAYSGNHPFYKEMEIPSFHGGVLKLIKPDPKYAQASYKWVSDVDVIGMIGGDFSDVSVDEEEKRLRGILENRDAYHWIIELNGQAIGNINLHHIDETSKEFNSKAARLTYLIGDKKFWGKGIISESTKAVLDWAFKIADFQVIKAGVVPENKGSMAIVHKLGFEEYETDTNGLLIYDGSKYGKKPIWINFKMTREAWGKLSLV